MKKQKKIAIDRINEISSNIAKSFSATASVYIEKGYPYTHNSENETKIAADVAAKIVGEDNVIRNMKPVMGSEDFSFMLNKVPGSYICIGQGDSKHKIAVHNAEYDFNDEILPIGSSYWVELVKHLLK